MNKVSIGIVGLGYMGTRHLEYLAKGEVQGAEVTAVCDLSAERLTSIKNKYGDKIQVFDNEEAMFTSGIINSVIIATPHFAHAKSAIRAFECGLHVMMEKPAGVYTKQVREMNEAAQKSGKVFGIMYNQRTNPLYQKVRDLIRSGELGEIKRTNWIVTNWYRAQSYFDSGSWRATWAGEGGGVLLNQAPHQLDLWQWMCGMPVKVRAFCGYGKYHDIEVEDDVTAYVEYENGASGVFITSTSDAPGTNRLEITADRGKVVVEEGNLSYWRLRIPERQFNKEYKGGMGQPECWKCEIPIKGDASMHKGITIDWVKSILKGTPMLAPGVDGIHALQLSNAMHLSSWTNDWVNLPVDEDLFYKMLQEKIENSSFKKR